MTNIPFKRVYEAIRAVKRIDLVLESPISDLRTRMQIMVEAIAGDAYLMGQLDSIDTRVAELRALRSALNKLKRDERKRTVKKVKPDAKR